MNKFNIKKGREKLTDQEMEQHMNFDKFVSGYTPVKTGWIKGAKFYSILVSVSVVLIAAGYLVFKNMESGITTTEKPFVDPPAKSMNVASDIFSCSTFGDTTLVYQTGTIIHVPASAFVDETGQDINGPVEIKFREFHDPVDIMVSGIPMNYDSAGIGFHLESAGMFEIKAYQNNKPLHLKAGKEISVNMVSRTNNEKDYNVYYLDTVKRKWNYVSENTAANNTCTPVFEINKEYAKKLKASEGSEAPLKPVFPEKANKKAYNFVIDFNKNEFPELAAFKGLKFEPLEGKKKQHERLAEKTWEDVLIERGTDGENYIITFSTEKETQKIKVRPVIEGENYDALMKEYQNKQKQYDAFLAARKRREMEKRDSLYRINRIYQGIVSTNSLNERFNNFIDGSFIETSKDMLVYRTFAVNNLGIWNSDKPILFFSMEKRHSAKFVSQQNEVLILKCAYILKRNINSVYRIEENNFTKFPFEKEIDIIVGVGYDNEMYYIKDEDVKGMEAAKDVLQFKMKKADGIVSAAGLKQFFRI